MEELLTQRGSGSSVSLYKKESTIFRSVSCVEVYLDFHNKKRHGGAGVWGGELGYGEAEDHHLEIQPESGSQVRPLL